MGNVACFVYLFIFSFCLYVVEEQKQFQSRIFRKIQAGQFMMHTYFVIGNVRNVAFILILFCWINVLLEEMWLFHFFN